MAQVNVTVGGRIYRMACGEGEEEHLLDLGRRVDEAITELRGSIGEVGDQRLAIMAAILMADRLAEAERQLGAVEDDVERVRRLERQTERYGKREESIAEMLSHVAERIEACAAALERGGDSRNGGRGADG